jgi:hypothetical protein
MEKPLFPIFSATGDDFRPLITDLNSTSSQELKRYLFREL